MLRVKLDVAASCCEPTGKCSFLNDIQSGFSFTPGSAIPDLITAQAAIYSSKDYLELLPYIAMIETHLQKRNPGTIKKSSLRKSILKLSSILKNFPDFEISKLNYKANILIVGEASRPTEIKMMVRLLVGTLLSGLTVIYITKIGSQEHVELSASAEFHSLSNQVIFLDHFPKRSTILRFINQIKIHNLIHTDSKKIKAALPNGIYLRPDYASWMYEIAKAKLSWKYLDSCLDFDSVIVKNHWMPISATVAVQSILKQKLVVTFQHGIISCPTAFSPIIASRILCFGSTSQELLRRVDKKLAEASNRLGYCMDFMKAGSLFDDISLLPNQQVRSCLLVIDQTSDWGAKFYGIQNEYEALRDIVRKMILRLKTLRKVIIRPHPDTKDLTAWQSLLEEFPDRVEISHPAITLQTDLSRSSVVLGLFSGAIAIAAASGLPVMFLREPDWFFTPDLTPFIKHSFVSCAESVNRIETLLTDTEEYIAARNNSLKAAEYYYLERKMCEFEPEFIKRLLSPINQG